MSTYFDLKICTPIECRDNGFSSIAVWNRVCTVMDAHDVIRLSAVRQ